MKNLNDQKETGIAAFAIRNGHLTVVIWLILSILGVLSLFLLPKDLLPSGNLPAVQLLSFYVGMPVDHVEKEITYPYERYTGQAVGVEKQESRSLIGVSIVKNFFNESIDLSSAISQTVAQSMSVLRKLPPGSQPPLILPFDPMAAVPLAMVSVGGDHVTEGELMDVARYDVTNRVQGVPGAIAPAVMGGKLRQAIVYLDPKKMTDFDISPIRVLKKLSVMSSVIPSGDIQVDDFDYQIESNGMVENLQDMNSFLLRAENGTKVRLSQVGRAEDSEAIQTNIVEIDGQKQAYLPVYRQPGANSLKVVDDIKDTVKDLGLTLSKFKFEVVGDQTIFIRQAIDSIIHEGIIGGGFAAIMVLFFLGSIRATFAVLLSLPLSILAAFAILKGFGQSLNVMSLGGLALSVGVLVDNAIVVIEVIIQKRERGLSSRAASIAGAGEVALPVLASTISTLVVFFPILFLNGVVRILFSSLGLAVVTAMAASYFAAMMVIPLFTTYLLPAHEYTPKVLSRFQVLLDKMRNAYGRTLRWTLHHRGLVLVGTSMTLVVVALVFAPRIGQELFPRSDSGGLILAFRGPTGLKVAKTNELSRQIQVKLREWIEPGDLKMIISNVGVYYGYSAAFSLNSGSQDGTLNVELSEHRHHTSQYYARIIRERLNHEFPQIDFGIQLGGLLSSAMSGGLVSPIDVQITSPSHGISDRVAHELLKKIQAIPGAVDARIQQRFDAPTFKMNIDREKAKELGLTVEEVVKNVVSATSNSASYDQQIWIDPKTGVDYLFGVQFEQSQMKSVPDLLSVPMVSDIQKRTVPLSWLATIERTLGATELNHSNLQPVVDIFLDAQDRDLGGVAGDIDRLVQTSHFQPGVHVNIKGEISLMNSALKKMVGGFLLAALLVYLIMVAQFRSFMLPAIVMTTVPMGLVGVVVMLAVTKTAISIQSGIGCIFVIGVAVSHGVLLVEYILECTHHGTDFDEAILSGAKARLRPILMTALASVLALLPMAFGFGQGSEANIPLGRAVIGGQILSTVLNFYLVPALFSLLYESRFRKAHESHSRLQSTLL